MPSTEFEQQSRRVRWHQSGLEAILGCARRWWLENEAGIDQPTKPTTAAGTAFHAALEVHERARLEGNPDGVSREEMVAAAHASLAAMTFDTDALAKVKHERPRPKGKEKDSFEGMAALQAQAEDAITNWWDAPVPDPDADPDDEDAEEITLRTWLMRMTPLAVEQYVQTPFVPDARELGGTIDGIYWCPTRQRVRLVDAKTSNALSDYNKVGAKIAQATHYSVGVVLDQSLAQLSEHLPAPELPDLTFMVVRRAVGKTKRFTGATLLTAQPTQHDAVELRRRVLAAEGVVAEGAYLPDPTYSWCKPFSCQFWDRCVAGDQSLVGPVPVVLQRLAAGSQPSIFPEEPAPVVTPEKAARALITSSQEPAA